MDEPPQPRRRRSNAGGNITLKSGASGVEAVAINIANTSQLLSLLDNAATGPGGKITILATGNLSAINVNGDAGNDTIRADRGTVDIRHTGGAGQISMTNAIVGTLSKSARLARTVPSPSAVDQSAQTRFCGSTLQGPTGRSISSRIALSARAAGRSSLRTRSQLRIPWLSRLAARNRRAFTPGLTTMASRTQITPDRVAIV